MAFSINVFMLHLAALLSGVKHCRFRFFSHKIPGAAGGWEVKEKVKLLKLFKLCSLHAYAEDSRVPLLTAVGDASLLNSAIIRSESAGKTGEMKKHTNMHTTDHRASEETFSSRCREHSVLFEIKIFTIILPWKKQSVAGF